MLTSKGFSVFFWITFSHEASRHFPRHTHTHQYMRTLRTFYIFAIHTGGYTPSIVVEMLKAIKESEENYKREARTRDEQLRSARQTSRSDINLYIPHWPTVHQLETATQDQTSQEYTSMQTPFTTFTQLHPMEATNTNHPKMTQYCKEQLPPQWTSSRPMQPT